MLGSIFISLSIQGSVLVLAEGKLTIQTQKPCVLQDKQILGPAYPICPCLVACGQGCVMNNNTLGWCSASLQMDILLGAEMCENIQNIPFWYHLAPVPILAEGPCNS